VLCEQGCSKSTITRTIWETNTKDYLQSQDAAVTTAVIIPRVAQGKNSLRLISVHDKPIILSVGRLPFAYRAPLFRESLVGLVLLKYTLMALSVYGLLHNSFL
jgi:hypothetical protein